MQEMKSISWVSSIHNLNKASNLFSIALLCALICVTVCRVMLWDESSISWSNVLCYVLIENNNFISEDSIFHNKLLCFWLKVECYLFWSPKYNEIGKGKGKGWKKTIQRNQQESISIKDKSNVLMFKLRLSRKYYIQ